ncbi:uncharacterized protein N7483_006265 [Penicillium malachiteum]|uniref:uncharacterized protein n=1 Tax=Penicillium malachiteum TaxID=1324776 RepID=UPI00254793CB|nr:uncharacterized protein N7483_006265 [Penicillium malachiteum]KAJ5731757.1 hypothetical protein N7483_006265 [Penicillium malachiteum]
MTDGVPEPEPRSTLADTIAECGDRLESVGLPRESDKFIIGQIGSLYRATEFLEGLIDLLYSPIKKSESKNTWSSAS